MTSHTIPRQFNLANEPCLKRLTKEASSLQNLSPWATDPLIAGIASEGVVSPPKLDSIAFRGRQHRRDEASQHNNTQVDHGSEEVLFQDLGNNPSAKAGWRKVQSACELARTLGNEWTWIDTCCIDKSNHDELTEPINSMFRWYKEATICYAYMADVPYSTSEPANYMTYLGGSRWFTRGWTLQELLAPQFVDFYSAEWKLIGSKDKLGPHLERITGIGAAYMDYRKHIHKSLTAASVAERMSWASKRQTTRIEDLA
ncbi:hypothetical protein FDECE_6362 [Fusarium decemcellulare]|nr:hypothetical protein FDECE_6362 [Fusarium decemcellulare]